MYMNLFSGNISQKSNETAISGNFPFHQYRTMWYSFDEREYRATMEEENLHHSGPV